MAKPLRETMPICTGFIDACREDFCAEEINAAIKAGMEGQQTFYASENGVTVGTKSQDRGICLAEMVIGSLRATTQAAGGEK